MLSDSRLTIHRLAEGGDSNAFASDVRAGLSATPKALSPKYFYDELGSRLFEAICFLPGNSRTRPRARYCERTAMKSFRLSKDLSGCWSLEAGARRRPVS